jgi:hypothetical protein
MEAKHSFNVFYEGKILSCVNASTKWEAIERVSSKHHEIDRSKIFAKKL